MANVLNKVAAYFLATALIFVLLEGCCFADSIYKYHGSYDEGLIKNRFQNENETTTTPATTTTNETVTNATTTLPTTTPTATTTNDTTTNATTTTTPTTTTTTATTTTTSATTTTTTATTTTTTPTTTTTTPTTTTTTPTTTTTTPTTTTTTNATTTNATTTAPTTTVPTTTPTTTATNGTTTNSTTTTTRPTTTPTSTTTNGTTTNSTTTTTTRPTTPIPIRDNGTELVGSVPKDQVRVYSLELPENGLTIRLHTTQGTTAGYYSFTNSQPNSTSNDGTLSSNGITTIRRPASRINLQQAASQVYIGIFGVGTGASNEFVVTASPAEAPPPDSAASLYINLSATTFCLLFCTFISKFIN